MEYFLRDPQDLAASNEWESASGHLTRIHPGIMINMMGSETFTPGAIDRPRALREIIAVFLVAGLVITVGWQLVGEASLARQMVVWVANIAMLLMVWWGLRVRGQSGRDLGLSWEPLRAAAVLKGVLVSLLVLVLALAAFVAAGGLAPYLAPYLGSTQQQADLSEYAWLRGNLPALILALAAVYIASSFGEEVIYRGFLIQRIAELGGGSRVAHAIAVAASALIFGLAHFSWGPVGIIQTTAMGLVLSTAYMLIGKNLWPLVLAHVILDTLLLVPLYWHSAANTGG